MGVAAGAAAGGIGGAAAGGLDVLQNAGKMGPVGLLGPTAGLTVGTLGGEAWGASEGARRGVGLVRSLTYCSQISYTKAEDGETLSKLRKEMQVKHSADEDSDDKTAAQSCEKMKKHSFNLEHAAACVKHSMLCAGRRGFVFLVPKESCRLMSQDATEFKAQAQKYNGKKKNPKGFFGSADWYENYEDFAKLLLDEN